MGHINIKGALIEYGVQTGVSSHNLTKRLSRCVAEQGNLQTALNDGVLPFWQVDGRQQNILAWKVRFKEYKRLIIVCSSMLAETFRHIDTDLNIDFVTSVSTQLSEVKGALIIVLVSEKWMQLWLSHHISSFSLLGSGKSETALLVCLDETASDGEFDADIETYTEVGICDERFVGFTDFALALYKEPLLALDGIETGVKAITEASIWNNPSALLAMVCREFGLMPHVETVFIVSPMEKLFMQHLSGLTGRMESGASKGLNTPGRLTLSQAVCLGEDGIFNMLSASVKQLVILIQSESTEEVTTLEKYQYQQYAVVERWLFEAQIPYVVWKIPSIFGVVEQMSFSIQWLHRSLLSVAMQDIDPTLYEDSDKWRQTSTNLWNRLESNLS